MSSLRNEKRAAWWFALLCCVVAVACGGESGNEGDGASSSEKGGDPADDGAGGGGATAGEVDAIPCGVAEVVINNCQSCHGEKPVGGAIPLVSHADWHQMSPLFDTEKKVYEVAQIRINDGSMPQGATLAAADLKILDEWLGGGAPVGTADDAECIAALPAPGSTTVGSADRDVDDECNRPGADDPVVARDGETCFSFLTHGQSGLEDTSKFPVPAGESYHELYYETPWATTDVMTRFGHDLDNAEVLHHYLIFTNNNTSAVPGQVDHNVVGTTIGTNSTLIGGWAVGGCGQELSDDLGAELPQAPLVMIQWHMYNTTGEAAEDGSTVHICVVPETERENKVGVTFLGTESFGGLPLVGGMPPGENHFTTECSNNTESQVTLLGFTPHMHLIGTNMRTDLRRLDGSVETIFDKPFRFDYQVGYKLPERVTMEPGETLITTCSYFNDTDGMVGFGESTAQEMCYNYVAYYPAGALNNGTFSLIGATNVCWTQPL